MKVQIMAAMLATADFGDTIELKTGERIEGVFREAGKAGAVIEVGGQQLTFPLEKVRAVYFGATAGAASEPAAAADALDALNGLRSLSHGGVTLRDYTSRTADARVRVGRFLDSAGGDAATKSRLATAMRLYELAIPVWNSEMLKAVEVFAEISKSDELKSCPAIVEAADQGAAIAVERTGKRPPENMLVMGIGTSADANPQLLWKCAEQIIATIPKP